jgi:hypothetical protein
VAPSRIRALPRCPCGSGRLWREHREDARLMKRPLFLDATRVVLDARQVQCVHYVARQLTHFCGDPALSEKLRNAVQPFKQTFATLRPGRIRSSCSFRQLSERGDRIADERLESRSVSSPQLRVRVVRAQCCQDVQAFGNPRSQAHGVLRARYARLRQRRADRLCARKAPSCCRAAGAVARQHAEYGEWNDPASVHDVVPLDRGGCRSRSLGRALGVHAWRGIQRSVRGAPAVRAQCGSRARSRCTPEREYSRLLL